MPNVDAIPCSICNGLFHRETEGQLFCLTCLNHWLDGEDASDCKSCRSDVQKRDKFQWLKSCTLPNVEGDSDAAFDMCHDVNYGVCGTHEQLQHFYCCTCKKAVCQMCVTYTHEKKQHKITSVADVCPQQRQFTKDMREVLRTTIEKAKEHIESVDACLEQLCTCILQAEKDIDKLAAEMIMKIKTNADAMKKRLKSVQKIKTEELQQEKSKAVMLEENMQRSLRETATRVDAIPDHVFVTQHTDIKEHMLKLCIEQQHTRDDISGSVKFVPNSSLSTDLSLGQLLHRRTLQMVEHIGDFKKITSVSGSSDGHLAICDQHLKDVTVFSCGSHLEEIIFQRSLKDCHPSSKRSGHFETPTATGFSGSRDLLMASSNKLSLFDVLSNTSLGVISRLSTVEVRKMAANNDQEIVVSDAKTKEIFVTSPLGQISRTLQVPYAASTSLAANGRRVAFANRAFGKVCIMDVYSGDIICEVNAPQVSAVCFDDDSASILVTRNTVEEMGIVEQYCSNMGSRLGVLATGLEPTADMTLLGSEHLVVAHKKYVKIFKIS